MWSRSGLTAAAMLQRAVLRPLHGMRQSPLLLGGPEGLLAALTELGCSVRGDSVCPAADGCPKAAAISVEARVGCPSFGSA